MSIKTCCSALLTAAATLILAMPAQAQPLARQDTRDSANPSLALQARCERLVQFRDTDLYGQWIDAAKQYRQARVFYDSRVQLRALRAEIAGYVAQGPTLEIAGILAQTTKTSVDLMFDTIRAAGADKAAGPGAVAVTRAYVDLRRRISQEQSNIVADAVAKAVPQLGATFDAVKNLASNTQQLMQLMESGSFSREMTQRLRAVDSVLATYDRSIASGFKNFQIVQQIKNEIDQACARAPSTPVPTVSSVPPSVTSINKPQITLIPFVPNPTLVTTAARRDPNSTALRPPDAQVAQVQQQAVAQGLSVSQRAKIARWIDPLTPPQTKMEMKEVYTNIPQCTLEWTNDGFLGTPSPTNRCVNKRISTQVPDTLRKKFMECEFYVNVNASGVLETLLRRAVDTALTTAAVQTLTTQIPAAFATGGTTLAAAMTQFLSEFYAALSKALAALATGTTVTGAAQAIIQPEQSCGWEKDWH